MDYLASIPYTRRAWSILSPARIDYLTARAGNPVPDRRTGFAWCEIGCGYGLTASLLAAANPTDRFVAIDLMPEHIEAAQAVASAAGLHNLQLIAGDVCELPLATLSDFDFIVMHGVYSWVPERVRTAIVKLIARKLRPGGRVLLSYNAQPGWSRIHPIRDLLLELAKQHPGTAIERVRHAMRALKPALATSHPGLASDPRVIDWVQRLLDKDPQYVAHEYFGDCVSFRFSEVHAAMRGAGLTYAGDAFLPKNRPEFSFDASSLQAAHRASAIPDVEQRQTTLDELAQTTFRIDVFAKPDARAPGPPQRFSLLRAPHEIARSFVHPTGEFVANSPEHEAVLARLAGGPATAVVIAAATGFQEHAINSAIDDLVTMAQVAPCTVNPSDGGPAGRYNALVLRQNRPHPEPMALACAATGEWIDVTDSDMVYLAALQRQAEVRNGAPPALVSQPEPAVIDMVAALMDERGWYLRNPDGSKLTDRSTVERILRGVFADTERRMPFYRTLGIAPR